MKSGKELFIQFLALAQKKSSELTSDVFVKYPNHSYSQFDIEGWLRIEARYKLSEIRYELMPELSAEDILTLCLHVYDLPFADKSFKPAGSVTHQPAPTDIIRINEMWLNENLIEIMVAMMRRDIKVMWGNWKDVTQEMTSLKDYMDKAAEQ